MNSTGTISENILMGQTESGQDLTSDQCESIIKNAEITHKHDYINDATKCANIYLERLLPNITAKAAEEIDCTIAAQVKQIKHKTVVTLQTLETKILAAECEINKLKSATVASHRSDNAFAKSQEAYNLSSKLSLLKQNEFIEKMKLKKQETDDIAALTAKAKLTAFKTCRFLIKYNN